MAVNYITTEEFKSAAELSGQTFADTEAELAISAASRMVDRFTGRRFYPDADATQIRYFTALSPELVDIGDLLTLTTIDLDLDADNVYETSWTALTAQWMLEPRNVLDGAPWQYLRTRGGYAWPAGDGAIKVVGKFGWLVAPPEVKQATALLANRLFKRNREAPFGVASIGIDQVGVRVARTDPDVEALLGPLRRFALIA